MAQNTLTDIVVAILRAQREAEERQTLVTEALHRGRVLSIELGRRYGMSWREIADVLDTTPDAARMILARGV